jgi:hypothetical protein
LFMMIFLFPMGKKNTIIVKKIRKINI